VLSDGHLTLRPPTSADAAEIVRCCDDPEIAAWTSVPSPYDLADARTFLHSRVTAADWWKHPTWVIEDAEGAFCGLLELRPDDEGLAELGYLIASWARGRGLATAAVRLACSWGLRAGGLQVITWTCAVGNDASLSVATKAGFRIRPGVARARLADRQGRAERRRDCWTADLLATDLAASPSAAGKPAALLLTARESEVLALIAEGASNRAIASRLGLSENTVKNHVRSILAKLHADSRTAAVVRGAHLGLISLST